MSSHVRPKRRNVHDLFCPVGLLPCIVPTNPRMS